MPKNRETDQSWALDHKEVASRELRTSLANVALQAEVLNQPRSRVELENDPELDRHSGKVELHLSDGNRLDLQTRSFGPKDGWPIIVCHGMPGSSIGPHPRAIWLYTGGIRLITWDRPGGGGSDRHEGRIVGDSATYVEGIAKAYGIKKCSVAGRSGGGPHALACANELPDLVVNAAVFSGIAPGDADIDWYEGALAMNTAAYQETDPAKLSQLFAPTTDASRRGDKHAVLKSIEPEMSDMDRAYLRREVMLRERIAESHADSLRDGSWQRVDDVIAARKPWGFDPRRITVPVTLIQGEDDPWTLRQHFQWLAKNIKSADAVLLPNVAHIETLGTAPKAYELLRDQAQETLAATSPESR